jgi:cell wall-associated NlpC family hydrolase
MDNAMILEEMRSWVGTPWKHGVALKGWGADCAQWIATFGKWLGTIPADHALPKYHRDYALHNGRSILLEQTALFCNPLGARDTLIPGDVLIFTFGLTQSHAGLYTENARCVHAHIRQGIREVDIKSIHRKDPTLGISIPAFDSAWRWQRE